jgi:DtxR family transcriptional regulator, Mn-dependent transcriptional regulator
MRSERVRASGLSSTLESYLEEIFDLEREFGAVRATDLAQRMGCKVPSATNALRRLAKLNLINYQTYRPVTLTPAGHEAIRLMSRDHRVLADFLAEVLDFPSKQANEEACRLEHRISEVIVQRLKHLLAFFRRSPESLADLKLHRRDFHRFLHDLARPSP